MWGIVVLLVAWGSVGALAESSYGVMGRLSWCSTLCMCETETNIQVQCFEEDDVYQLLDFNARAINRLRNANWTLHTRVDWCTDLCLCNIQTGKQFHCTTPGKLTQLIINKIGDTYFLLPDRESDIKQEAERSVDEDEDPSLDQDSEHRRRSDRRKNKKNRKHKKNQRTKHRKHPEDSQEEPESEPEPQSEPEPELYTPSIPLTPTPPMDTPSPSPLDYNSHQDEYRYIEDEVEEFEIIEEHEPLPKQEAVAASPVVTALQPPMRKLQPYTTEESYTPRGSAREVEGLSPRVQPVVEVPKEKKTVASMVSQDLDDLGSTVRNIKNDVMLNQRILLVTVAIAGIAMLGVLILAVLSCANRRQNQAANAAKKRDSNKDGNHSPKINLEEAW